MHNPATPPGSQGYEDMTRDERRTWDREAAEPHEKETVPLWEEGLLQDLGRGLVSRARELGLGERTALNWLEDSFPSVLKWLELNVFTHGLGVPLKSTPGGRQQILSVARAYLNGQWPEMFGDITGTTGAGGPRKPTADDIRNRYDVEALAGGVNDMWRAYLKEESEDPRGVARAYVEAIVSNPDQALDFEAYVLGRIRGQGRWQVMYANKPDGQDELSYLQPYDTLAQQYLGGSGGDTGRLGRAVAQGAGLGATPDAFRQKLQRTDEFSSTDTFINGLGAKVRGARAVLR